VNYCAIVVTYYPKKKSLNSIISVLENLSITVIIIDNTPGVKQLNKIDDCTSNTNTLRYRMGQNTGIAAAQNYGINIALERSKDAIFLFDQDSVISIEMINRMVNSFESGEADVLAPVCLDNNIEIPSFLINDYGFASKIYSSYGHTIVDLVIASGCLVRSSVFKLTGVFDENLFIDYVDFDWCFRCRDKGIVIKVVPDAIMRHSIGFGTIGIGRMKTIRHNSFRTYYKIRNPILLMRKSYIPKVYCLYESIASLKGLIILIFYGSDRFKHLRRGVSGFFAGIFPRW
jgi:rhamnosyltransferase